MSKAETRARWQRIEAIFDEVVDLPPGQQDQHVTRVCGGDELLRLEVLRLLARDRRRRPWIADIVAAMRHLPFRRRPGR